MSSLRTTAHSEVKRQQSAPESGPPRRLPERRWSAFAGSPSPRSTVPIDSFTDVPADLFDRLLKDGMRAKARGQHRLCRSPGTKRQHLVRDKSPRPVRRETTSHVGAVPMRDAVQTASSFAVARNISSKRESIVPKTYTNARRATCSRDQMPAGSAKVVPQRCRSLANDTSQAQGTKYSAPQRVKSGAMGDVERKSRSILISWWADSATCGPVASPAPWFSETVEGLLHQAHVVLIFSSCLCD